MFKRPNKLPKLPLNNIKKNPNERFQKFDAVLLVLLILFALAIIFPFYYFFILSITPTPYLEGKIIVLFTPVVTFDAYKAVFTNSNIWGGFKITTILLVFGTIYQLFFTVITGYALSRNNWVGKKLVMNMILITMFFSGGMIPYYILIKKLGMMNSIWVLIIPGAIDTFNMLLMRNYFASLPKELEESAHIDGANDIQIFVKIFLPLSLPMLATIGLFFAVGNWNSWYNGMMFNSKGNLRTLQQVLQDVIQKASSDIPNPNPDTLNTQSMQTAAVFFSIIPMMCLYPFVQKFFVKGIVVGAIKG